MEEHFHRYIDMWLKIGQKGLFRGLASMEATQSQSQKYNLYSISKILPIGEVLVQIGQLGAEILSSLRLVLLS